MPRFLSSLLPGREGGEKDEGGHSPAIFVRNGQVARPVILPEEFVP